MLKALFEWLDARPGSYWTIAWVPTLLLLGWLFVTLRAEPQRKSSRGEFLFALLLLSVLVAWRWPFLLSAEEYNPDESQLIAGASTLRVDAVPWRGVDGFTSGPLNFYPLAAVQVLGLPLDYFTARMVALLLVFGALLASYRLLRSRFGTTISRLSVLPVLGFFSTVTEPDFVHYSSEHLSLFLTALSACYILSTPVDLRRLMAGCFVAGMFPFAKLQSAPLAAALFGIAVFLVVMKERPGGAATWKSLGALSAAAAVPSLVLLLIVGGTGQFEHFSRSYFLQNFVYMGDGQPVLAVLEGFWNATRGTGHFPWLAAVSCCAIALGAVTTIRAGDRKNAHLWFVGAGLFIASLVSILGARRDLLHYLLLCVIPLLIWQGLSLGEWATILAPARRIRFGMVALAVVGLGTFGLRTTQPPPEMFGLFAAHWREPYTALGSIIRSSKSSQSRLAIWGWLPGLYVESGLPQGTRDGNSSWAMIPSPYREYYRERFLSDMQHTKPDFFVDAVGTGSRFFPDRTHAGHESFSALADYVQKNYQLVTDEGYARLYAKKDREVRRVPEAIAFRLQMTNTDLGLVDALPRESITPANLPLQPVRTGFAQMMHPPAEIIWSLAENTREIIFDYGFLPEAYRQKKSDGAELIFELRSPGVPTRNLFYRFLDPVQRPSDRGPVTTRLVLPPFKAGARLVARTTVGPAGNGAWDWIYLGRVSPVRMTRYSPEQFPHFNRVPDSADADFSYLLQEPGEKVLILHAPAALAYNLTGKETRLRFDYGLREGAYSKGGQTDGANFEVSLVRSDGAPEILFRKQLDPTGNEADRGVHPADIALPADRAPTKLTIRIDPGKSNAWDWTYITNLALE